MDQSNCYYFPIPISGIELFGFFFNKITSRCSSWRVLMRINWKFWRVDSSNIIELPYSIQISISHKLLETWIECLVDWWLPIVRGWYPFKLLCSVAETVNQFGSIWIRSTYFDRKWKCRFWIDRRKPSWKVIDGFVVLLKLWK